MIQWDLVSWNSPVKKTGKNIFFFDGTDKNLFEVVQNFFEVMRTQTFPLK